MKFGMKKFSLVRIFSLRTLTLLFSIFTAFSLSSCSQAVQESEPAEETLTLRYAANELYNSTVWTEAIEVDRLTASVSSVEGISSKLTLSPLVVAAASPADSSKVFPELKDFGSLDTRLISPSLKIMLDSFSECICKYKDCDSLMVKKSLFSLALFYSDFNSIFSDTFDLNAEEVICFTSSILGQPLLSGSYYEVPVKFMSDQASMTLSVFCVEEFGQWKIDQIQIAAWEIFNGKK